MEAQTTIDAKLVRLERRALGLVERMRKLKEQRNKHATVSKLPDEVLLEIFMVLMARFSVKQCHQIAHVCRRWRGVSVEAPMLWTNPPTDNYLLVQLMLKRSKGSSLTVCLGPKTSLPAAKKVLSCIARVDSLELDRPYDIHLVDDEDDDEALQNEEEIVNALLAALRRKRACPKSVKICDSSPSEEWFDSDPILRRLRRLDSLRKLFIKCTSLSWKHLPVNNLTHLWLQKIFFNSPIPIQQFIDILPQMPLLESLSLPFSMVAFSCSPTSAASQRKVVLPCLRQINLTGCELNHISYFLENTTFPRLRCMELSLGFSSQNSDFLGQDYLNLLQAIAHAVAGGEFGTFENITAKLEHDGFSLSMSGTNYERPHEFDDLWSPNAPPHIGLSFPNMRQGRHERNRLCEQSIAKLRQVTHCSGYIHLNVIRLNEREFKQLLGTPSYSPLQTITIVDDLSSIPTLASALTSSNPSVVPFPHLKSISFKNRFFVALPESEVEALCSSLMSRRQNGFPLNELIMWDCCVTSSQQTRLEQAVTKLELI